MDNPHFIECLATLENLFPKLDVSSAPEDADWPSAEGEKTISVVMLGGDSTVLEYQPHLTILSLKDFVKRRLGPDPDKQRLLYKEQELKVMNPRAGLINIRTIPHMWMSTLRIPAIAYVSTCTILWPPGINTFPHYYEERRRNPYPICDYHFQDQRDAASLRHRNRRKSLFVCVKKSLWFSCPSNSYLPCEQGLLRLI